MLPPGVSRFGYTSGKTALITLGLVTPPQLDEAFVAAMGSFEGTPRF
jgi:hypothetical protein